MVEEDEAIPLDEHVAGHAEGPLSVRVAARGDPADLSKVPTLSQPMVKMACFAFSFVL